jgi:hypothetical protein
MKGMKPEDKMPEKWLKKWGKQAFCSTSCQLVRPGRFVSFDSKKIRNNGKKRPNRCQSSLSDSLCQARHLMRKIPAYRKGLAFMQDLAFFSFIFLR